MNLAIIGLGNMGLGILRGALRAGLLRATDVAVAEPDEAKRRVAAELGTAVMERGPEVAAWLKARGLGQLLLAVKPQMLYAAVTGLEEGLPRGTVAISILAGTPIKRVQEALGDGVPVVRAMPNLPAAIGQGATALCRGPGTTEKDADFARELFRAIGPLVVDLEEGLMDAFTAIAGSGPAYFFYLAEAMENAAAAQGLTGDRGGAIVRQTLMGAAMMYAGSESAPAAMRAAVTSKGGTTAAAVGVLDQAVVMATLERAMLAARDRGRDLGS
ncbi:MAG: pyrroline-5-carboxylate reductase [Phycisphaerae bacterium]|nr:pyrroline-5-carboxylate reductase [Phycisphaerae bacterium]